MRRCPCRRDQREASTDDREREYFVEYKGKVSKVKGKGNKGAHSFVACYNRGRKGHMKMDCWSKPRNQVRKGTGKCDPGKKVRVSQGHYAKDCRSAAQLDAEPAKQVPSTERVEEAVTGLFLTGLEKNPELKSRLTAMSGQLVGPARASGIPTGAELSESCECRLLDCKNNLVPLQLGKNYQGNLGLNSPIISARK